MRVDRYKLQRAVGGREIEGGLDPESLGPDEWDELEYEMWQADQREAEMIDLCKLHLADLLGHVTHRLGLDYWHVLAYVAEGILADIDRGIFPDHTAGGEMRRVATELVRRAFPLGHSDLQPLLAEPGEDTPEAAIERYIRAIALCSRAQINMMEPWRNKG